MHRLSKLTQAGTLDADVRLVLNLKTLVYATSMGISNALSPYLTGLRLFCDSWRQTSRVARKAVSKQSPVIRNILACVAKWRKVVAKILNMFKNFMRQNSSQNSRKVVAGFSNPSRTCRRPLAIQSQSFWNMTYLRDK